jgi:predicted site-specific integrase-resolvase
MTRAAIYCRVSTAKQEDDTSLPTQLAGCRAKAKGNNWQIVAEFEEVNSGAALYRKEWDCLLSLSESALIRLLILHKHFPWQMRKDLRRSIVGHA